MREKIVFALYQHLLLNKDLKLLTSEIKGDEYYESLIADLSSNEDKYIELISSLLNNWTFDRLAYLEQAILLLGVSELELNEVSKAIVVDEAIRICKEYCDEDSYKYINGVLDNYESQGK